MDVREQDKQITREEISQQEESKLNDSLIFNIIKKIELKMAMEDKYEEQRIPIIKQLPESMGKFVYSPLGVGYFVSVMAGMLYFRYKYRRPVKLQSFLPHFLIAFTLNQVERYRGIMGVDQQMKNEYKSYQANSSEIISQKKRRFSWGNYFKNSQFVTHHKIIQMIQFRPIN